MSGWIKGAILAVTLMSVPALAASPCPTGRTATIRISSIKPTGSMDGFRQAAAAHLAWYKSHGFKTEQSIVPVLSYDRAADAERVSTTEIMTIRTGDDVPRDKHDAAWDAYVAQYKANSDIVAERRICLPATM